MSSDPQGDPAMARMTTFCVVSFVVVTFILDLYLIFISMFVHSWTHGLLTSKYK